MRRNAGVAGLMVAIFMSVLMWPAIAAESEKKKSHGPRKSGRISPITAPWPRRTSTRRNAWNPASPKRNARPSLPRIAKGWP